MTAALAALICRFQSNYTDAATCSEDACKYVHVGLDAASMQHTLLNRQSPSEKFQFGMKPAFVIPKIDFERKLQVKLGQAFGIHEQALRVRTQRNEMLASNIANADTPGYKARDLDFREVLKQQKVQPVNLKATQPGHMQPGMNGISPQFIKYRTVSQPSLDGNTVDTQQEQIQFAANTAQFEATMRFLNGKIQGIEKALKGE